MRKVIMDVDTGSDDALAIMAALFSVQLQLQAICCVSGSRPVEAAMDNTLRLLHLLGREDVPVYRGVSAAMVKGVYRDRLDPRDPAYRPRYPQTERVRFHIDFDYLEEAGTKEQDISAVEFYLQYLRRCEEKVTIVATGPLTNLAMVFRIAPELVGKVEEIVIMGGGVRLSNVSVSAEANIWRDPEAAGCLLASGADLLFVPLDATHEGYITETDVRKLDEMHNPVADFAARLCRERIRAHTLSQPLAEPEAAAIHDALALCWLIDPQVLCDIRKVHCEIGLRDFSDGQTIIDPRYYPEEPNCRFAFHADRRRFIDLLISLLAKSREVRA